MSLTDDNLNATMLMQPAYDAPYGGGFGGGGLFGGNNDLLGLLFVIALCNGGFGGFGFGGGYGAMMGMGMMGMDYLYPWLNNSQNINDGFRDQMLNNNVTSIRDGVQGLSTQLCQCCGDMRYDMAQGINSVNSNLCNGINSVNNSIFGAQTAISQQMNANEIANLNRSYAEQAANTQGFTNVNAGVADLRYTVATEACADRAAVGDALQNVTMQNVNNTNILVSAIRDGIQSIKDDLCADRLEAERRENANLRSELMYARGQASQTEQTAQILANNNAQTALFQQGLNNEVDALYSRLSNCPVPTVPVFGNQRIFTCQGNNNPCGCGCGSNNF